MAKVLRCRDLGLDCDFEAQAEDEDTLMAQAEAHAREVHGLPELPDAVKQQIRQAIREQ